MAIVGDVNNIESIYVIINEVKYHFDSFTRALEILFKSFHALDIKYPKESKHVWIFIEEAFFDLRVSGRNGAASALLADLKYHTK